MNGEPNGNQLLTLLEKGSYPRWPVPGGPPRRRVTWAEAADLVNANSRIFLYVCSPRSSEKKKERVAATAFAMNAFMVMCNPTEQMVEGMVFVYEGTRVVAIYHPSKPLSRVLLVKAGTREDEKSG